MRSAVAGCCAASAAGGSAALLRHSSMACVWQAATTVGAPSHPRFAGTAAVGSWPLATNSQPPEGRTAYQLSPHDIGLDAGASATRGLPAATKPSAQPSGHPAIRGGGDGGGGAGGTSSSSSRSSNQSSRSCFLDADLTFAVVSSGSVAARIAAASSSSFASCRFFNPWCSATAGISAYRALANAKGAGEGVLARTGTTSTARSAAAARSSFTLIAE